MLDAPDPYKTVANAIGQTPTWVFHGAKDESVPVEFARKMVKILQDSGNSNVKYTEYPDDGHQIVTKVFHEPGFFEWLAAQRLATPDPSE
jgi:predicted esterase